MKIGCSLQQFKQHRTVKNMLIIPLALTATPQVAASSRGCPSGPRSASAQMDVKPRNRPRGNTARNSTHRPVSPASPHYLSAPPGPTRAAPCTHWSRLPHLLLPETAPSSFSVSHDRGPPEGPGQSLVAALHLGLSGVLRLPGPAVGSEEGSAVLITAHQPCALWTRYRLCEP